MTRRYRDPDDYCPICGGLLKTHGKTCPEKTLRGIDAAHGRDPDNEEPRKEPPFARVAEWERLMRDYEE